MYIYEYISFTHQTRISPYTLPYPFMFHCVTYLYTLYQINYTIIFSKNLIYTYTNEYASALFCVEDEGLEASQRACVLCNACIKAKKISAGSGPACDIPDLSSMS